MNKEVKEIVKSINTRKEYVGAPYMTLETKKIDLLLDYINQLETNIYTAIDYLNKLEFEEYGVLYDNGTSIMEYEDNCKETLLEILEGGKE